MLDFEPALLRATPPIRGDECAATLIAFVYLPRDRRRNVPQPLGSRIARREWLRNFARLAPDRKALFQQISNQGIESQFYERWQIIG